VKERHPNSWRPILEAYGKIGEGGREGEPPTHLAGVKLDPSVVVVNRKEEVISSKKVVPHVVEPSFGLDRLTLACMVYAYSQVEDRVVMKIPRALAPLQVGVFPLVAKAEMVEKAKEVQLKLEAEGMDTLYDDSGTIGRRYARADEAGLPLAVTVDGQTLEKGTVTVRDRDTWKQVTVGLGELAQRLKEMLS
jgi:glycyl-tRNA synthetase